MFLVLLSLLSRDLMSVSVCLRLLRRSSKHIQALNFRHHTKAGEPGKPILSLKWDFPQNLFSTCNSRSPFDRDILKIELKWRMIHLNDQKMKRLCDIMKGMGWELFTLLCRVLVDCTSKPLLRRRDKTEQIVDECGENESKVELSLKSPENEETRNKNILAVVCPKICHVHFMIYVMLVCKFYCLIYVFVFLFS